MRFTAQDLLKNGKPAKVTLVLFMAAGLALSAYSSASAQSRYIDARDYQANAAFGQAPLPPAGGAWRSQLLRRGCNHGYPMAEQAACGTATGGPAGGIN